MPHVKIWNYPRGFAQSDAGRKLYRRLHEAIAGIEALELKPEHVTVNYVVPAYANDSAVIVYIDALLSRHKRNYKVRCQLADVVRDCVVYWLDRDERFDCNVEVFVRPSFVKGQVAVREGRTQSRAAKQDAA